MPSSATSKAINKPLPPEEADVLVDRVSSNAFTSFSNYHKVDAFSQLAFVSVAPFHFTK